MMPASLVETGIFLSSYTANGEVKEVREVKAICFTAKYTSLKGCWL